MDVGGSFYPQGCLQHLHKGNEMDNVWPLRQELQAQALSEVAEEPRAVYATF